MFISPRASSRLPYAPPRPPAQQDDDINAQPVVGAALNRAARPMAAEPTNITIITELRPHDFLVGRGGFNRTRPANIQVRAFVEPHRSIYDTLTRLGKRKYARWLVHEIRGMTDPPRRFLKPVNRNLHAFVEVTKMSKLENLAMHLLRHDRQNRTGHVEVNGEEDEEGNPPQVNAIDHGNDGVANEASLAPVQENDSPSGNDALASSSPSSIAVLNAMPAPSHPQVPTNSLPPLLPEASTNGLSGLDIDSHVHERVAPSPADLAPTWNTTSSPSPFGCTFSALSLFGDSFEEDLNYLFTDSTNARSLSPLPSLSVLDRKPSSTFSSLDERVLEDDAINIGCGHQSSVPQESAIIPPVQVMNGSFPSPAAQSITSVYDALPPTFSSVDYLPRLGPSVTLDDNDESFVNPFDDSIDHQGGNRVESNPDSKPTDNLPSLDDVIMDEYSPWCSNCRMLRY